MNDILNKEIEILLKYWSIIYTEWDNKVKFVNDYEIKLIEYNNKFRTISMMDGIKNTLFRKLGAIPVYFFLNLLFGNYTYSGQFRSMEKGIMLLYHLVQGCEKQKIINLMSDYKKVYDEFWYYRNNDLHKIVDKYLKVLFSNVNMRLANGYASNPEYLKSATLILDSYLNFYTINKSNKIYNKGYITPYLCDNNGMIIQIFETKPYYEDKRKGIIYEEQYFWDIALNIDEKDLIAIDDKHDKFKDIFISYTKEKHKKDINDCFITPMINNELNTEDIYYNSDFNKFYQIGNNNINNIDLLFPLLSNKQHIKNTDIMIYNLQIKICVLLNNIINFVNKYNIPKKEIHFEWKKANIDFPKIDTLIYSDNNEKNNNSYEIIKNKKEIQKQYLNIKDK